MNPGRAGVLVALFVCGLLAGGWRLGAQALPPLPATSLPTSAPQGTALLVRGPDRVRGIPFFSPNAIPALRGSYLIGTETVDLWFTRDPLVFGPDWSPAASWATGSKGFAADGGAGVLDLALPSPTWTVIFRLPSSGATMHRFVAAFVERFGFFLDNARLDADISFPATVSY